MSEAVESPPARIDVSVARAAFDTAIESHAQQPESFFLARLLGLDFSYAPGRCCVAFEVRDFMFNPRGTLHGGVLCLALDVSMGHLMLREGVGGATLELKTQFVRAATAGRLRCEAVILRRTRHVWFMESRCVDLAGDLVAVASSTWAVRAAP
jgi:uncharacterized protein (TIGR00369 family)